MKCPLCDRELQESIQLSDELRYFFCDHCNKSWISKKGSIIENETIAVGGQIPVDESPKLTEGTRVYVDNREHKLHLEQGIITKCEPRHYRVKLVSTDQQLNGRFIWFPSHWIKEFSLGGF